MTTWRSLAAANNAQWCDVVCRSHGANTRFDADAWTSRARTPPYYPDAVTLAPDVAFPSLLGRIDTSAGCSIKDSFCSLDLTTHGFRVVLEAQWIVRGRTAVQPAAQEPRWELVRDRVAFAAWVQAWADDEGPLDVLRPEVLDNDAVRVVAARRHDRVVAGAVLNHNAGVLGISNFFADVGVAPARWAECIAFAETLFPGSRLVGYESGDALATALAQGFETVGSLRVWVHEGPTVGSTA